MQSRRFSKGQKGTTMAEFAIVAGVFFMIIFAIIEFGRLLYTHNALTDAARRGARYAVLHTPEVAADGAPHTAKCVKNVVIYGETHITAYPNCNPTGSPLVNRLQNANIEVTFVGADLDGDPDSPNPYGTNLGTATVTIKDFQFTLSIPFARQTFTLPNYTTTLTAESAGNDPPNIP